MTNLANALAKHMEYELTQLSYLTALLDEEGIRYRFLPRNSKVIIFIGNFMEGLSFEVETCEYGYKLSPKYVDGKYCCTNLKTIERSYAETIIDNIWKIIRNVDFMVDKRKKEIEAWKRKLNTLHKKEYLEDVKNEYAVNEYQVH
ncbi:hypothetical protein [Priestia megaterium]|uniref:hypothetical protein n=1 Tax=Priestia megaterium TaxID=1404 RepID=UPI00301BA49F